MYEIEFANISGLCLITKKAAGTLYAAAEIYRSEELLIQIIYVCNVLVRVF
jgi:hypothetical protein